MLYNLVHCPYIDNLLIFSKASGELRSRYTIATGRGVLAGSKRCQVGQESVIEPSVACVISDNGTWITYSTSEYVQMTLISSCTRAFRGLMIGEQRSMNVGIDV